jgi:hypothetical protein
MTGQQVQLFLADLAIIILLARLLGIAAKRLGQPPVLGEIIAGILLGPTLFHGKITATLFPTTLRPPLSALANLGVVMFMFAVGYLLDLRLIRGREHSQLILCHLLARERDTRLEVATGLGGELRETTRTTGSLQALADRASARGVSAVVRSRFSQDIAVELPGYVAAAEPDTIVLGRAEPSARRSPPTGQSSSSRSCAACRKRPVRSRPGGREGRAGQPSSWPPRNLLSRTG